LSLASRFCYQAATPQRFSQVKFTIRNKEKLRSDVERLLAMLSRHNLLRYVRRVVTIGCMDNGDESDDRYGQFSPGRRNADNDSDSDSDDVFGGRFITGSPLSTQQKQTQNEAWLPFTKFLGHLPALTDLVYACIHQMPPCVLTALQKHHPKSRLHIDSFNLRSLRQKGHQLHDIDPDDFALVTSPCLYSLRASCVPYDDWGRFDFNREALEHIVASGCAPALKKVSISHRSPSGTLALVEALREPRYPWKGFFLSGQNQPMVNPQQPTSAPGRGCLETLALSGNRGNVSQLVNWNARTDFGFLRCFEYDCGVPIESLQFLTSMAASGSFRSLRKLRLGISDVENDDDELDQTAGLFLQALPPLETLTLERCFGTQSINATLNRHGPTLRQLRLLPDDHNDHNDVDTDATRIREIQKRCPILEDVELRVRRRQGGPEEVAVYRTLGRIPRLRRAKLLLDCRAPYDDPTHGRRNKNRGFTFMFEPEDDAKRVRNTLINLAIDETLATQVFHEIVSAAPSCPLERLTLKPIPDHNIAEQFSEFNCLGEWVGRSWACTRRTTGGEVTVREINVDLSSREFLRNELEIIEYQGEVVWDTIWPNKGGDWRDNWHSFPLWREKDGVGAGGSGKAP
jgi:hypothetical protein